jgi:hypothetical protein
MRANSILLLSGGKHLLGFIGRARVYIYGKKKGWHINCRKSANSSFFNGRYEIDQLIN